MRGEGGEGGGGEGAWVVGHPPGDANSGVGEVRRRVSTCLCPFPRFVPFLPFLAILLSLYLEFRVNLSELHKCPWFA